MESEQSLKDDSQEKRREWSAVKTWATPDKTRVFCPLHTESDPQPGGFVGPKPTWGANYLLPTAAQRRRKTCASVHSQRMFGFLYLMHMVYPFMYNIVMAPIFFLKIIHGMLCYEKYLFLSFFCAFELSSIDGLYGNKLS